ncbi:hypothetical protein NYO98_10650 [Nocardioides sp. STR2]|uniref:HTH cro/C1-type domain-containing protein n=1 Tax=Nocardioides pini TaxID=2975053 RepID=A0ABT4CCQ4_9ACTN|nr:hypothetical protein [Nocardioides pini]MCY4726738.1 hypothetical protein [Nocardioides pini]
MSTDLPPTLNLAALIRREQDNTGASYMDIAKRSGLSKAKIGQLADPASRHQVRGETLVKLAEGLRLPLPVVRRAAMVTAGISDESEGGQNARIELIASQLALLDETTLETIAAMIDAAVRSQAKAKKNG